MLFQETAVAPTQKVEAGARLDFITIVPVCLVCIQFEESYTAYRELSLQHCMQQT